MPFLTYLDLASVDPVDIVDRDRVVKWLQAGLDSFFRDRSHGRAIAILGERGIGKSIVMRRVIDPLRERHGSDTLFLVVDCRGVGSQRRVYHELARQAVDQLKPMRKPELFDTARVLETLAKFDEVERRVLSEHLTNFKAALQLAGKRSLLSVLGTTADIGLEYSRQRREALEGKTFFDAARLRDAVIAFFSDLRETKIDVVVVLDNLDELRHEALGDDERRRWLHEEIDGLLCLTRAPIGLVITARTYFAGSLNRQIDNTKILDRLSARDLVELVAKRLAREPQEIRAEFAEGAGPRLHRAPRRARAPPPSPCSTGSATSPRTTSTAKTYPEPYAACSASATPTSPNRPSTPSSPSSATSRCPPSPRPPLLRACGDNQAVWQQLLRNQIILPIDFWHPNEFTLAPELHFLCRTATAA
jgi:hypothetical protein